MADQSNPWATTGAADSSAAQAPVAPAAGAPAPGADAGANPWGSTPAGPTPDAGAADWLNQAAPAPVHHFDIMHPFDMTLIPLDTWVEHALNWVVSNFRPVFQAVRWPVDTVLTAIQSALLGTPAVVMLVIIGLIAWQVAGLRLAIGAVVSLIFVGLIGAWDQSMVTLALVFTSVLFCLIIGLPSGIWMARRDGVAQVLRPILDAMQTTPAFVYLVPIVMLFGIGNVPGVVVTIIFALPPLIRLTNLGIRQVPEDLVEASRSFGASNSQLLYKVQLPIAMPTIMAGVNQTLMLALSMVVIASMIAVGGLGQMVLRGIGRLDMGLATVGGVGIVILAIIIDRITQSLAITSRDRGNRAWYETGPVGLVLRLTKGKGGSSASDAGN